MRPEPKHPRQTKNSPNHTSQYPPPHSGKPQTIQYDNTSKRSHLWPVKRNTLSSPSSPPSEWLVKGSVATAWLQCMWLHTLEKVSIPVEEHAPLSQPRRQQCTVCPFHDTITTDMASAMALKLNYPEHYTKRRRKREKKERKGVGNGDCDPVITESPEPSDTSWRLASSRKWMWAHLQAPPRPPFLRSWYRPAKENTNEKWLESTKYLESSLEPILVLALGLSSCTGGMIDGSKWLSDWWWWCWN